MDPIADVLSRLGDATPQELSAALAAIAAAAAEHSGPPTAASTLALTELASQATQVRGELTRRDEMAVSNAAALASIADLTALPEPPAADPAPVDPPADPTPEGDPVDPPADPPATDPNAVTAAGRRLGGVQRPGTPAPAARPRLAVEASPLPGSGLQDGQPLTRRSLAEGFARKAEQMLRTPGVGRQDMVRFTSTYPSARFLNKEADAFTNMEKVEAVQLAAFSQHAQQTALVAAGLCAPLEPVYDIPVVGDDARPVRDALARFGADRGGITYRPTLDGVTQTGGIGTWTKANDVADPLVDKSCVEIVCPGVLTAEVEATYMCMEFSNMSTRFDPEQMDASIRAQEIAHARFAENKLLAQLRAGSKALYTTKLLGAARDLVVTLDKLQAYYRSVHRLAENQALRAILPRWARDLLRADVARQMVGDGLVTLAVADAVIDDWFRARNVNVTWHLDGLGTRTLTVPTPDVVIPNQYYTALAAEAAVPGFPDNTEMFLFQEGSWLYLDGGELNLGLVRDSDLNARNRFQTFSESFEIAANRGLESMVIALELQPIGGSAATISTAAAVD